MAKEERQISDESAGGLIGVAREEKPALKPVGLGTGARRIEDISTSSNRIEDITKQGRIEDISKTKRIEDIPKPPIAQSAPPPAPVTPPAATPFAPPASGSAADKYFKGVIQEAIKEVAVNLAQTFVTPQETEQQIQGALGSLRGLDSNAPGGRWAQMGPGGTMIYGSAPEAGEGGGMDYSDFAFGFSLNPDGDNTAEIGINAGKVRHGIRTPVSVATTKIVIGADQTWIFVAYTYGSTGTITSSTSEPVDTETVHNHVLHLVTLTDGVASVETGDIKHLGDIFIPGAFA